MFRQPPKQLCHRFVTLKNQLSEQKKQTQKLGNCKNRFKKAKVSEEKNNTKKSNIIRKNKIAIKALTKTVLYFQILIMSNQKNQRYMLKTRLMSRILMPLPDEFLDSPQPDSSDLRADKQKHNTGLPRRTRYDDENEYVNRAERYRQVLIDDDSNKKSTSSQSNTSHDDPKPTISSPFQIGSLRSNVDPLEKIAHPHEMRLNVAETAPEPWYLRVDSVEFPFANKPSIISPTTLPEAVFENKPVKADKSDLAGDCFSFGSNSSPNRKPTLLDSSYQAKHNTGDVPNESIL